MTKEAFDLSRRSKTPFPNKFDPRHVRAIGRRLVPEGNRGILEPVFLASFWMERRWTCLASGVGPQTADFGDHCPFDLPYIYARSRASPCPEWVYFILVLE